MSVDLREQRSLRTHGAQNGPHILCRKVCGENILLHVARIGSKCGNGAKRENGNFESFVPILYSVWDGLQCFYIVYK